MEVTVERFGLVIDFSRFFQITHDLQVIVACTLVFSITVFHSLLVTASNGRCSLSCGLSNCPNASAKAILG
jgi:hypothetical protein